MTNDSKDTGFKSYILDDLEAINLNDSHRTKLLEGETLVTEAPKVVMFTPLTDHKKNSVGFLSVTTFKLSFVRTDNKDDEVTEDCFQHNLLLGPYEICLSCIDTIYQIGERTRKKLTPGQNVSGKIKEILIICKNMRMFEFSFKHSDKDSGKNVVNALLHHAYPRRHALLFAYDYKEPYYKTFRDIRMFHSQEDWQKEIGRIGCKNWRISLANQNFQLSMVLPQVFVVPSSVTDVILTQAAEHFRKRCCPVWAWSAPNGAALVRMSDLLPTITDRTQENIMLENIRKSHAEKRQPYIMDLAKDCPSSKELRQSFNKLRELCTPDSIRTFKTQDFKFYGLLDTTKWLHHVSTCLSKATEAYSQIFSKHPKTVVLQENNGQDMNCVVSSLTQLLSDSYFRTMNGFESLIQKEWVALGHPFASRLGLVHNAETEQSPLFLLFLDCVWQLLQQFPTAFQFSETLLTTMWDSVHITIFDTFLFDSEHHRFMSQSGSNPLVCRSIWDWREQFTDKDIMYFCNPLYDDACTEKLKPNTTVAFLDVWSQCYFRWLPDLEIRHGGRPQIDLSNRLIAAEIHVLRQKLLNGDRNGVDEIKEENLMLLRKVNSFFPFSYNNGLSSESASINNYLLSTEALDSQSILNHSTAND